MQEKIQIGVGGAVSSVVLFIFAAVSLIPALIVLKKAEESSRVFMATAGRSKSYLILAGIWSNWIWLGGLLGAGEGGYLFGLPASWAYPFGWWFSMFLFVPLIKKLRKLLPHAMTHTQFMKWRFDEKTGVLYTLGALAIIIASIMVNIVGVGIAFEAIGGIPYWVGVVAIGGIIVAYVAISGMWAVNITCFIQTLFLGLFACIISPLVIFKAGGPGAIASGFAKQGIPQFGHIINKEVMMAFFVPMTLSYVFFAQTDPSVWQKGFSVSYKYLRRALLMGVTAAAVLDGCMSLCGVTAKALLPYEINSYFAVPIAVAYWAPRFSVVFLIMTLCAMLSTGSSLLNACATYINVDILQPYLMKKASDETLMRSARWLIVGIGIVSTLVAAFLWHGVSLLGLIVVIGVVISIFAIPVTLGLFWSKVNGHGVFWSTIAAVILTIILWFAGMGGVWSAALWKIMLVNYIVTGVGPVIWTLVHPQEFNFDQMAHKKI